MDEWLGRLLTITYPVLIVCATGLLGYWMKLRHHRQVLTDRRQLEDLAARVDTLQADLAAGLTELNERIDFAERLLARGSAPSLEEGKHPTPV